MSKYDVLIIGGGLSGLSCAIELVNKNKKVLLLEERSVLGGRTSSWMDRGIHIESGFHRFLGFFNHLPQLLISCGIDLDKIVTWENSIEIRLPDKQPSAVFGIAPLFSPLTTAKEAVLNEDFLPANEKLKLAAFFMKGFGLLKTDPKKLDTYTVSTFAIKQGLSKKTIHRVLIPLTEGLFFLRPEEYSAYNFFALFAPFIPHLLKSRAGAFNGGMSEVMANPLGAYIKQLGGEIKTGENVTELIINSKKIIGAVTNTSIFKANAVVLATSLYKAQHLIKSIPDPFFKSVLKLPSMPSVTFQIDLKEPSMDLDRTTFSPGTIFSAYTEQSRTTFKKSKGRISIILATPHKFLNTSPEEILKIVLADARRLDLNIPLRNVKSFHKVTWEHDFITYERNYYTLRPEQKTPLSNFYLAGDYTKQKYLSTMEGAAYSGKLVAEMILNP